MTDLATQVRDFIAESLCCDRAQVVDEALFTDLGADSLDGIELALELEDHFNVMFGDNEIEDSKSVGNVVAVVTKAVQAKGGSQ